MAPDDKPQARANIIKAINEVDWGSKTLSVRINGLDTHYWVPRRGRPDGADAASGST